MHRICFVCLGNICRSVMAEFIMKDKVNKLGLSDSFLIASRGTSGEEEGNDMYPLAKEMLDSKGISYGKHRAMKINKNDYDLFDMFICMDDNNVRSLSYVFSDMSKVFKLLDRDIADPWYSGDFLTTYTDLCQGINKLLISFDIDQK